MDNFLMSRGRPREPVRRTCGEELVRFWLWPRVERVSVFEPHWWWTPRANGHLRRDPCLLERRLDVMLLGTIAMMNAY